MTVSSINLKLFGKNALIYALGTICLRAAPFLLIPLYTYSLSISDYGMLATLVMSIQIMTTFMDLGTRKGFTRFAVEHERKNLIGHLLTSAIFIIVTGGLVVTTISLVFLLPFFRGILHIEQVFDYVALTCGAAVSLSLYNHILSYYRARNEVKKYLVANAAASIILIIINLVVLFIFHQGVRGALLAQIVTYGASWFFVVCGVFAQTGFGFSWELVGKLFRFGSPLVFAMAGELITEASALFFLSYFVNLEQVAIYSLGHKIAQIAGMVLILPFQLAYEPFVFANINSPGIRATIARLLTYLMLAFAFIAFAIVFVFRDLLPLIAPPEYFSAYALIFLMLPGIAFKGVYYIAESLLQIENKTHTIGLTVLIIAIVSVLLNYLLVPSWGIYGVIVVLNVGSIATAVTLMILGIRVYPINLEMNRLGTAVALLLFLLTATFLLSRTSSYLYYSVLPSLVCLSVAVLYFGNFCNNTEKDLFQGVWAGICAKFPLPKFPVA